MLRIWFGLVLGSMLATHSAVAQQAGVPQGPDTKGPQTSFTAWNGSYRQTIPIEVPAGLPDILYQTQ